MDAPELDRIATGTREVHAMRGEVLFRKGDPCDGFHLVVYGQIKLAFTSPSGVEKVVELMGPGQSFGEAVMFTERPYPVYSQALVDSMLLHIAKAVVFEEIERDPAFARKMIGGLSRRLHSLVSDLESYTLHSGMQRVIGYLLRGEPEKGNQGAPLSVALPSSKTVIASRLNLTPEHFSRILHDLMEAGLIRVEGRSITILDLEQLRTFEG
ncbi:MAG: Crp/Fnr family transcriptional regulator [Betaproteobacteria bacterium RIFCSPLOWO2_12_FULL_62_13]|nr:MAG: Crp/Fnr family transcriptional regulator [Betaproteobacteria bacterium RIFCSPLOWO2_12_FULL_62_13]